MRPALGSVLVALFLLGVGLTPMPTSAQQDAADPFAKRHHDLLRAAEFHLAHSGKTLRQSASLVAPAIASMSYGEAEATLAPISLERVAAARKKLLALGVDAARVFAEEGVPEQLLVVAEIESAFNPNALSPKGARGLWQFMPETARRHGLRVNERVDERLHVARSTRAAARYLRHLYLLFGDWQLALAAYNAGEERITAAIQRVSSSSFGHLVTMLPEETQLYVRAVIGPARRVRDE